MSSDVGLTARSSFGKPCSIARRWALFRIPKHSSRPSEMRHKNFDLRRNAAGLDGRIGGSAGTSLTCLTSHADRRQPMDGRELGPKEPPPTRPLIRAVMQHCRVVGTGLSQSRFRRKTAVHERSATRSRSPRARSFLGLNRWPFPHRSRPTNGTRRDTQRLSRCRRSIATTRSRTSHR